MPDPRPSPAAITVHRTDSGQFMLSHPSGATVLGDSLDGAWAALTAQLDTQPAAAPTATAPTPAARPRWLLPLLIVLPFAWLGTLWLALGSIRAEVRGVDAGEQGAELSHRIGALEAELGRLGAAVDALRDAPKAPPPSPKAPPAPSLVTPMPMPAAPPPPR